jgi:hypothetical protein
VTNKRFEALLTKYNPAVTNYWLIALAGTTWGLVGILLCHYSYGWLSPFQLVHALLFALIGCIVAVVVYGFGMSTLARKNLDRLAAKRNKSCLFGFLTWKSYANIGLMVALGIALRHSPVPKDYLSIVYTSMGGALLMGSIQYYRKLLSLLF